MRLLLILALTLAAGCSAATTPMSFQAYRSLLQERLAAIVEAGAVGVLAEVRHEGRTYLLSSGKAELGGQTPPVADGRFRAWSITKTVTATGVLKLVADGRLSLEDTVETHLPGLLPDGGKVKVRHLLNHTSGIADYVGDLPSTPQELRATDPEPRDLVASVAPRGLAFTPGSEHAYSNTNYAILGLIIEKVTSQPWRTYLTRRVITSAGLEQTILPGQNIAIPGPHAHHYAPLSGRREPQDVTELNPAEAGPAGEMISTAADINTFYAALLTGRLLPAELLKQMLEVTDDRPYGLGVIGTKTPCAGLRYGHTGSFPGYRTQAWSSRQATTQVSMSLNLADTNQLDEPVEEFIEAAFCP
ncbi:beta-lactamase family protein [Herbidospora galbida]|uniref:Beta-lactamase family protein n=1 Tax=Herbidospora galbida TaxID=2575442 RepID=A0A4V5V004_9ACTN|nr:serine hydrolase domain-containing protein [Herbidospora galbida]TKK90513.1 beta-lactamase family protein [Herbidospora galbida]